MDWLNKSFTTKRKQNLKHSHTNISCKPFPFSKEQVRVLLYRDCDWRGRKLLFDSTAVRKVALARTINSRTRHFAEVFDGFGYKFLNKNADTATIAEMIFGAVAVAHKGTSLKIHWLSCPSRLLCTQVFVSPLATPMVSSSNEISSDNFQNRSYCSSLNFSRDTISTKTSNTSTLDSLYSTYTTTSSDLGKSSIDSGYAPSYFKDSDNSLSRSDVLSNKSWDGKHTKLGLAVCVTLTESLESEMQYYYMEHIPLIESMMNRLQLTVKQAYVEKLSFFSAIVKGFEAAAQFIYDLFRGPIIGTPFWLALSKSSCERENSAQNFIDRLYKLLNIFDTKGSNFFLSTLITAILTHHLGWVNSIAPNNITKAKFQRSGLPCCLNFNKIRNCYPVNALWAQLGDLYGIHGYPIKICKTIISCADSNVVNEIITVLTYFIRCRNINRAFCKPIFENSLYDVIMRKVDIYNKSIHSIDNNTSRMPSENGELFKITLRMCESGRDLEGKDYLINLRICSFLFDQIWEYIDLKDEKNENLKSNFFSDVKHCTFTNVKQNYTNVDIYKLESDKLLYHLKDHDDVRSSIESNTNLMPYVKKNLQSRSQINGVSQYVNNSGLKYRNKESYPNLSSLIAKDSPTESTSQLYDDDNDLRESQVNFVLGNSEAVKNPHKLNKIIPPVDKEFVQSKNYQGTQETIIEETYLNKDTVNILDNKLNDGKNILLDNPMIHCVDRVSNIMTKTRFKIDNVPDVKLFKKIVTLPLLKSNASSSNNHTFLKPGFATSLFGGVSDHYVPDMVLQGTTASVESFVSHLSGNVALSSLNKALLDNDISESVSVIANIEEWKVQSITSNTNLFSNGITVNIATMSKLVSNMLEVVQQMRKLKISADFCIKYIERKLFEMYLKSKTLAEMLINTDFCELSWITSSLGIEVADVPLLMSIASMHSPCVTKKYILSYR